MTSVYPSELGKLLSASREDAKEQAWEQFLAAHSRLMLHTVRQTSRGHDETMDRYAFVLDKLRVNDYQRLQAYRPDERTRFTTWLVVVVRRLCVDHHRAVYGRPRGSEVSPAAIARRDLAELVTTKVDIDAVADQADLSPEQQLRAKQLHESLSAAIAALTPRDRLLIRLRFDDAIPVKEISDLMGFPSQFHVYRQLKTVFRHLRRQLSVSGFRDGRP